VPRTALEALAREARTEQPLVARGVTDAGSMYDTIWATFRDDVAPWATLDYAQDVIAGRLLASIRATAGPERPSVAIVSSPAIFDQAGVLEPFEAPFADRFPPGWADAAGRWTPLYVQPIVAIYNVHRTRPPRGWLALGDGLEPGRLVFDDPVRMLTTGPALAELSSTFGEAGWEALIRSLADRRPNLVADNERAVLEVSTGARWVGLSNWNVARRVRPGTPVRHTFLSPTPCIPGFGLLVRDAPNAGLARLFLAWLGSDRAQQAYARTGRIPARLNVDASPSLTEILPAGVEPLFGTADWLTDPVRWTQRFRDLLPADRDGAREGKLR